MSNFVHLHVHSQYSVLDGYSDINKLIDKALSYKMPAVALTDHGNMLGAMKFTDTAYKKGVKPIIGMEAYMAEGSRLQKEQLQGVRFRGYHLILLAKNYTGYKNLCKLSSYGFTEGYYYNPRIDRELLEKYSEGLIVSSACLAGELPYFIRLNNKDRIDETIRWHKKVFKDDYYLELMDHGLPEQKEVNEQIIELAKKYDIKLICTNDVHFVDHEDHIPHDILVCINTQADYDSPERLRYTGEEYFKSPQQMAELFPYAPDALDNTLEIANKVEEYQIRKDKVILPVFPIPDDMPDENAYLRKLTYEGAEKKYPAITEEVRKRLDYELEMIKQMGFPGYFLIVQDFISYAKKNGVSVGPGRGSAAGSAVAYAIGITDVEPIKYNLLFERFLNPERVSMPDIDIDFDDYGREKVIQYVIDKYGADHVAQIVTIGKMAAKSAIRDVGRVLKVPLPVVDNICNSIPDNAKNINDAIKLSAELSKMANEGEDKVRDTIKYAAMMEGSIRQTGVHACGVIIGPEALTNHIPVTIAKDADMVVTQYEGTQVEAAGMLKMDFLGLRTLSIIQDAIENIYQSKGIKINIDTIEEDDPKAFEIFRTGNTVGLFQFESPGMQKYLKELQPENLEDLIAMNALYRPGPMDNIPSFIDRKHGKANIEYPHPLLEDILQPTYGIMVYQEQIMQAAQRCAGFSLGKADILRRAMGKKKMDVMASMKKDFVEGCKTTNNITEEKATKIFDIMEKFASYGFNRSHSAAYSVIAYKTAYLKGNFPAEYMAAVLTHNQKDLKKIMLFTDECQRLELKVLAPDINVSRSGFAVNKEGNIVFGLGGISGVGNAAVEEIISERDKNGPYKDIKDFVERVNTRAVNKSNIEALAAAGAFDVFGETIRAQILYVDEGTEQSFADTLAKYGTQLKNQRNSMQTSLFGDVAERELMTIDFPEVEKLSPYIKLKLEKKYLGMYVSGHPLDQYAVTIKTCANVDINTVQKLIQNKSMQGKLSLGALVTDVNIRTDKRGNEYARFSIEDFNGSMDFIVFSDQFLQLRPFLVIGACVFVEGAISYRNRGQDTKEFYFKIQQMHLLDTMLNKTVKKIILAIDLAELTKEYVEILEQSLKICQGNCRLILHVNDREEEIMTEMEYNKGIDPTAFAEICKKNNYKVLFHK